MVGNVFCVCPTCEVTFPLSKDETYSRSGMVRCVSCRNIFAAEPNRIHLNQGESGANEVDDTDRHTPDIEKRIDDLGIDFSRQSDDSFASPIQTPLASGPLNLTGSPNKKQGKSSDQIEHPLSFEPGLGKPNNDFLAKGGAGNVVQKADDVADYLDRQEPESRVVAEPEIQLLDLNMDRSIGVNPPQPRTAYDSGLEMVIDDLDPLNEEFVNDVVAAPTVPSDSYFRRSRQSDQLVEKKTIERREKIKAVGNGTYSGIGASYEQTSLGRMRANGVDEYIGKRSNPLATIVWSLVTIVFIFLLGVQVKYFFVEKYEQHETYRKYLVGFCKVAGCDLSPRREPYSFTLTYTKIELHPQQPSSLRVTVKMVNEAQFSQPYPDLQLTLTDRVGRVVGRRIYSPDLYLPAEKQNLIDPGSLREVVFDLLRPHEKAVGFVVAVSVSANSV
ncbi:MAG: DUF3426 domain-containing protein [Gammaproteobacteria bacterium]|nr:DUF3426 domain-containing protein [Gammaproteobacteria bacterium]